MAGRYHVHWTVRPITPPRPWRHCSSCGETRPFVSSGAIRLNANGRHLDAWLIYKCARCDRTWNRPLLDRVAVKTIPAADLEAMHQSDPDWVHAHETDLAALGRHSPRIDVPPDVTVSKPSCDDALKDHDEIVLAIDAPWPTGLRLDRLLATEFGISRSRLQAIARSGGIHVAPETRGALRKPVAGRLSVAIGMTALSDADRAAVLDGLYA